MSGTFLWQRPLGVRASGESQILALRSTQHNCKNYKFTHNLHNAETALRVFLEVP
jgi:hypothetical protein